MNDTKTTYIGLLTLSLLLLCSCAQEYPEARSLTTDDDEIRFFTSLPGVETRSTDNIDKNSIKNGFSVAAASLVNGSHRPKEQFKPQWVKQTEGMGEAFRADSCRWPSNEEDKDGKLRFFAFYPSLEVLKDSAGLKRDDPNFFRLEYTPTTKDTIQYWMRKFKVNTDITKHSDFVTATAEGSKKDSLYTGVTLTFQHQLSRLNFEAFGNSDSYYVEIAGVRVGGVALESDFSFEGTPNNYKTWNWTKKGRWIGAGQVKGCVEYIFNERDTVVTVGNGKYLTKATAKSIMGTSGFALVIPYDYSVWTDYKNNANRNNAKLYFSVLLRVKEKLNNSNTLLYPYIEGAEMKEGQTTSGMHVVYLSVETATGKIKKRLYKKGLEYYTDPNFTASSKYIVPTEEDVRNYGWAAAIYTIEGPTLRWNPGYQYTYQLNYSKGIGLQDPADISPGKPIISPIEVTGSGTPWHTVNEYVDTDVKDVKFTIE